MFEPVTTTSSIVMPERPDVGDAGDVSWPNVIEAESRKIPATLIPTSSVGGCLITPPRAKFSTV
jgi:hypothetical protein